MMLLTPLILMRNFARGLNMMTLRSAETSAGPLTIQKNFGRFLNQPCMLTWISRSVLFVLWNLKGIWIQLNTLPMSMRNTLIFEHSHSAQWHYTFGNTNWKHPVCARTFEQYPTTHPDQSSRGAKTAECLLLASSDQMLHNLEDHLLATCSSSSS